MGIGTGLPMTLGWPSTHAAALTRAVPSLTPQSDFQEWRAEYQRAVTDRVTEFVAVRCAEWHRDRGLSGSPDRFGKSAAVLLGDLCLVWAEQMQRVLNRLSEYGESIGQAFQLRDHMLGVFGAPAVTGKAASAELTALMRATELGAGDIARWRTLTARTALVDMAAICTDRVA